MCIAVPMKIINIDSENKTATVSFSKNKIDINISLVSPKIGDYVLVHAGCAIEILTMEAAHEMLEIFNELEEISRHES